MDLVQAARVEKGLELMVCWSQLVLTCWKLLDVQEFCELVVKPLVA